MTFLSDPCVVPGDSGQAAGVHGQVVRAGRDPPHHHRDTLARTRCTHEHAR